MYLIDLDATLKVSDTEQKKRLERESIFICWVRWMACLVNLEKKFDKAGEVTISFHPKDILKS